MHKYVCTYLVACGGMSRAISNSVGLGEGGEASLAGQ